MFAHSLLPLIWKIDSCNILSLNNRYGDKVSSPSLKEYVAYLIQRVLITNPQNKGTHQPRPSDVFGTSFLLLQREKSLSRCNREAGDMSPFLVIPEGITIYK
jgi:hypothetical protein